MVRVEYFTREGDDRLPDGNLDNFEENDHLTEENFDNVENTDYYIRTDGGQLSVVNKNFYPSSMTPEDWTYLENKEREPPFRLNKPSPAVSGEDVEYFFSYFDLFPIDQLKPKSVADEQEPRLPYPTAMTYPMAPGINEENYEEYLPTTNETGSVRLLIPVRDRAHNYEYVRQFPFGSVPISRYHYRGGWTEQDLRKFIASKFQEQNIRFKERYLDQMNFQYLDWFVRVLFQIDARREPLVTRGAFQGVFNGQFPRGIFFLELLASLYQYQTSVIGENTVGLNRALDVLHLEIPGLRPNAAGFEQGKANLFMFLNWLNPEQPRYRWFNPQQFLARMVTHPEFYEDWIRLGLAIWNLPYTVEEIIGQLERYSATMLARIEERRRRAIEYRQRDDDREEQVEVRDPERIQVLREMAERTPPRPTGRLAEDLERITEEYGQETGYLVELLSDSYSTYQDLEGFVNEIAEQLGTDVDNVERALLSLWNGKIVSPRGPVRCRNKRSVFDMDTILYLENDDDLASDSSGLCYTGAELGQLTRAREDEYRPHLNPDNIHFSDLRPRWLGRNLYSQIDFRTFLRSAFLRGT